MELTNLSVIRELCERYHFSLSKGFGQNFIINSGICPKIVESAQIDDTFGVLEIGPGIGVLTKELCQVARKVVSVELDKRLIPILSETMALFDNFTLIMQDILKVDLASLIAEEFEGMRVAVCANLPYYITSPVIMRLLEQRLPIENITVMLQKEAAERLCANVGTRQAGAITYAVQYYAQAKVLFTVQPGSFFPPPKVMSAVIQLRPFKTVLAECDEVFLFQVIHAAFQQRRKTAANAISTGIGFSKTMIQQALVQANLPVMVRPEQMTLQNYIKLCRQLQEMQKK